jgi:PKD repeat protein
LYLDGVFKTNVSKGVKTWTETGLNEGTSYTIGTRTCDANGNINMTWVNQTTMTAPAPVPPECVTDLHNTTYEQTSITWNWTDPSSADFDRVKIYLNGVFKGSVTKGNQTFTATGLKPSTEYVISTRTVGSTGLVNQTWVNTTATTASSPFSRIRAPLVKFTVDHWFGVAPLTVHFSALSSSDSDTYLWSFGDGSTSTEKNPVHSYHLPGYYRVTLTTSNEERNTSARGSVFVVRSRLLW